MILMLAYVESNLELGTVGELCYTSLFILTFIFHDVHVLVFLEFPSSISKKWFLLYGDY